MAERVCIVGLGYVGLPLALRCAEKGLDVHGFDVSESIVKALNNGKSHIKDDALEKKAAQLKGKIFASSDEKVLAKAETIVVCVPTPVDEKHLPDLSFVESACKAVAKSLRKGMLVVVESTVSPGTVRGVCLPLLEKSGLKAGKDFFLAHCPERIDPGNKKWPVEKIPRVLGGISEQCAGKAKAFYGKIIDAEIVVLNSVEAAEAVKITENTFRDINIAFVNELARSFDKLGIDVKEVIKGASTKPFGYMPFYPGPGVGGHCIFCDPYYLIETAKNKGFEHKFLLLAREINNSMPAFVFEKTAEALAASGKKLEGSKIALLGLAYKPDVDDLRESPSLKILELLKKGKANVRVFDPFIPSKSNVGSLNDAIKGADAIVLATNHSVFIEALSPKKLKAAGISVVVDARNALDKEGIVSEGITFRGIGR
ncbi:MAG: nucleotide sugar dehydrogenase [Candidatus Diapherotrites archaeon]